MTRTIAIFKRDNNLSIIIIVPSFLGDICEAVLTDP